MALFATQVAGQLARDLDWTSGAGWALPLAVLVVGTGAATALWLRCAPDGQAPTPFRVFLMLAFFLAIAALIRALTRGEGLAAESFSVLILIMLVWLKPPSGRDARTIVGGLAWVFVAGLSMALAAEMAGLMESWYGSSVQGMELLVSDSGNYWLPLQPLLGIEGRWAGSFEHPNHVGPIGAYLMVVAVSRRGLARWVFLVVGTLVLVLAASRTSLIAALAGTALVVAITLVRMPRNRRRGRAGLLAIPGVPLVLLAASTMHAASLEGGAANVVASAGSGTGRTSVWGEYWRLFRESPIVGLSETAILDHVDAGLIPEWARGSAHNLVLDYLARTGIVGTALLLGCLAVVAVMAIGAARRGLPTAIGLVAVLAVCAVTESLIYWQALTTSTLIVWAAVFASMEDREPSDLQTPTVPVSPRP